MYEIDFKTRMYIASGTTLIWLIPCVIINRYDMLWAFAGGAFGYQIVDYLISKYRKNHGRKST